MAEHANIFAANPRTFLGMNAVGVGNVAEAHAPLNWQSTNDAAYDFSIANRGNNRIPMLRIEAPAAAVETMQAKWCNTSQGAHANRFDEISFCDFARMPGAGDARFVFTGAMNGCGFIVVSSVPFYAGGHKMPHLAASNLRLYHDRALTPLAAWHRAGFKVRFAAYGGAPPGVGPAPLGVNIADYNRHNYPWSYGGPPPTHMRGVMNFLYYTGGRWIFGSRHFHQNGATHECNAVDIPPGRAGSSSTQFVPVF